MAANNNIEYLSQTQILQNVYDNQTSRLRTDAAFSGNIDAEINVELDAANDSVAIGDGTNTVTITPVGPKKALDVYLANDSFNVTVDNEVVAIPSGLSTGLRATRFTVTDVPLKVPPTALTGRNSLSIRVLGVNTVYFGNSTVVSTTGYPKFQYEEIIADLKDNSAVEIYLVCEAGKTCEVAVFEIA